MTDNARALILPRVLLVEDVAEALGISPSTAAAWLRSGRIPGSKIGRRWLVSREQLLARIEGANEEPPRPALAVLAGGAAL